MKLKEDFKKILGLKTVWRGIFFTTLVFLVYFGIVYTKEEMNYKKQIAGESTCDTKKQMEQLSYLYEAKIKTQVMKEKIWNFSTYLELVNKFPEISKDEYAENKKIIDGAPGFREDMEKEIESIAIKILNVKQCQLLDDKTAEEFKNFHKYDTPSNQETTKI